MPNREFLEKYPLYRKFKMHLPARLMDLKKVAVHMDCPVCGSEQTFNMTNNYQEWDMAHGHPVKGCVVRAVYKCTSCNRFPRYFLLKFGSDQDYVMKVGQEPPIDITLDPTLKKALGSLAEYYKKGRISESQSYGIGAFGYYRRIVESFIDKLLTEIKDIIPEEDREPYLIALEKAKEKKVAADKISLVKDLLPPQLRPGGMNPLQILHDALSEGLHQESDERCTELAEQIREVLEFLAKQVAEIKTTSAKFTKGMRKLLDRHKK